MTGIVRDDRYMLHFMGPYHPERPERLEAVYAMLDEEDMAGRFQAIPARPAKREEICLIHSSSYVDRLEATQGREYTYLDPDTQTSAGSYEAALLAVGGVCEAIDAICAGQLKNAFALVRPPGHHAEKARAMGFCLFNNVAIGAQYAREHLNLDRVLIVDWDLHHGNGTQHAFEHDPTVLYFSTHQYPYYPGTGSPKETGKGKGEGFTVNIPLYVDCADVEYVGIFDRILRPIALEFRPDLILVSAGFDCYAGDPLGGMGVTSRGFAAMTRVLMEIADACCDGRVMMTLEGGYDVEGQAHCVKTVLRELAGLSETLPGDLPAGGDRMILEQIIQGVRKIHQRYWKNL
jgi:acetoin utilization deacetylase AcuC-like enzyme